MKIVRAILLIGAYGSCYLAGEPEKYLHEQVIAHTRGAPYHPMTQGKIERFHRTVKNQASPQD